MGLPRLRPSPWPSADVGTASKASAPPRRSGSGGPALAAVGLEGVHIHDLRHTGNQFTANAGANPRELMARTGHGSPRAALIYMHSSDKRQRGLADAVAKAARAELAKSKKGKAAKPSGTRTARRQARRQGDTSGNEGR